MSKCGTISSFKTTTPNFVWNKMYFLHITSLDCLYGALQSINSSTVLCNVFLTVLYKIACGPSTFSAILYFYLLFIKYHKNAQFIKIIHYNQSESWSHFVRNWNWRTYLPNGTRSVSFNSFLGKCRNSRHPLPENRKKNKIETNVKIIGKGLVTSKVCVSVRGNIDFMKMKMQM